MNALSALDILKHPQSVDESDIKEAIQCAISALEKQIPKKPILDTIFPSGVRWYLCPVCKHNNIEKNDNYCHNCGQALDWSEEE